MSKFKIGDNVKVVKSVGSNLLPDYNQPNVGKTGSITGVHSVPEYDPRGPNKYDVSGISIYVFDYELELIYIGICSALPVNDCVKEVANKKTMTVIKKVGIYIKKMTDGDTQALISAGYINGDLEPTEKALQKLAEIMFFANKAALVEAAKEDIAEAESEANKK